jgi:hypothetical protein
MSIKPGCLYGKHFVLKNHLQYFFETIHPNLRLVIAWIIEEYGFIYIGTWVGYVSVWIEGF